MAGKLPPEQRRRTRLLGLILAMVMRILLLFAASWVVGPTEPLFSIGPWSRLEISGRDLILAVGGAFLIYKAVTEIHEKLEGHEHKAAEGGRASFSGVIVQILLLDMVFSLDSVITAVGMVDELSIMIAAMVLAIVLMLSTAGWISGFVDRHPTVKMRSLSFLVLIGASLLAKGFDFHLDKPLTYGPIAFAMLAVAVETLNPRYWSRPAKRTRSPGNRCTSRYAGRPEADRRATPGSVPPPAE